MGGPMAYLAPGHSDVTACASTWEVEWRSTSLPLGVSLVMISTVAPSGSGVVRSASVPLMVTATAALASREPMAAARSAPVDPAGRERDAPSGRWIVIESAIADEGSAASTPPLRSFGVRYRYVFADAKRTPRRDAAADTPRPAAAAASMAA